MNTEHKHHNRTQIWMIYIGICAAVLAGLFLPAIFIKILTILLAIAIAICIVSVASRFDQAAIEQKLAQHDAKAAQLKSIHLSSVINAADIPLMATDHLGHLTDANTRSHKLLGVGESMIGRRFDEIMPQIELHELERHARNNEPGHARLTVVIAGEKRELDVSADPMPLDNSGITQTGAVMTFRDITELSRAMTLKADFVANASHELRTPIASIKGAAETLSGPARNDEKMANRLIEMITNNATRLELLAEDLLDLSRAESDDQPPIFELVQLSQLFDRITQGLEPITTRRSITICVVIEDELDEILTDPTLLGLIVRNLVGNAVKFAHEGTSVQIVVKRAAIAPDRTTPIPQALIYPAGITLQVIDQGVGIPLVHQQRIFERFYQVDDARTGSGAKRGTGLGLAIVKHASRRLGGAVGLESVHQVGTTVTVELPRCVPN